MYGICLHLILKNDWNIELTIIVNRTCDLLHFPFASIKEPNETKEPANRLLKFTVY